MYLLFIKCVCFLIRRKVILCRVFLEKNLYPCKEIQSISKLRFAIVQSVCTALQKKKNLAFCHLHFFVYEGGYEPQSSLNIIPLLPHGFWPNTLRVWEFRTYPSLWMLVIFRVHLPTAQPTLVFHLNWSESRHRQTYHT